MTKQKQTTTAAPKVAASTLRPGILVVLKSSIRGNVSYNKQVLEGEHLTADGQKKERWETERVVSDPTEHEAAKKARSEACRAVSSACRWTAFGLLCPEDNEEALVNGMARSRKIVDEFNATARTTRIAVYAMPGRVAPDEIEAVRAINGEVRELLADMEEGIRNMDVEAIRKAAKAAREVGAMLSPSAAASIQIAIDQARAVANKINKAGVQASVEVDKLAIKRITEQRTMFIDVSEAKEVAAPKAKGRALDLAPVTDVPIKPKKAKAAQLDL